MRKSTQSFRLLIVLKFYESRRWIVFEIKKKARQGLEKDLINSYLGAQVPKLGVLLVGAQVPTEGNVWSEHMSFYSHIKHIFNSLNTCAELWFRKGLRIKKRSDKYNE